MIILAIIKIDGMSTVIVVKLNEWIIYSIILDIPKALENRMKGILQTVNSLNDTEHTISA